MTTILTLPTTHEGTRAALDPEDAAYYARLAQFVQPVETTEGQVVEILSRLQPGAGRAALLLGPTGSGKSTFAESLAWRKHLGFARFWSIDCSELNASTKLDELTERLQDMCKKARQSKGRTAIAIDYLENLTGLNAQPFFQTLNGLLRKSPVFVLWPVTDTEQAERMVNDAKSVSNTIFDNSLPTLHFTGPDSKYFPAIATNAIGVFNSGRLLQEFMITPASLDELLQHTLSDINHPVTIRSFLERVHGHWAETSGHLDRLKDKLPRPNEVWIVFCHPKSEDLVGQFANKSRHVDSAWKAFHSKLWEYIPGTQRAGKWTSSRLQYAIEGALTTRIIHMSPQSVVSATLAYGDKKRMKDLSLSAPDGWEKGESARKHIKTTALYRQLTSKKPGRGKTPGGPAAKARENAERPFAELNTYLSGSGRDRHVNRAIAKTLSAALPDDYTVAPEQLHPWIPNITPDIRIDTPDGRQINLEFCYTNKQDEVWRVPDYTLDKLVDYMDQLDVYVGNPLVGAG